MIGLDTTQSAWNEQKFRDTFSHTFYQKEHPFENYIILKPDSVDITVRKHSMNSMVQYY